jgi:hypothetical protein
VHLTAPGSCTITASQSGNANYFAAPDVPRSFTINSAGSGTPFTISGAMEGSLSFSPGVWVNGGWHVALTQRNSSPVTVNVTGNVLLPVRCSPTDAVAGTVTVPVSLSLTIPARNTSYQPTGDQKSQLGWLGAVQAPDLCAGGTLYNTDGATLDASFTAGAHSGSLNFEFHYRVPAAVGRPDTNCTTANLQKKDTTCSGAWSTTLSL